ncbi:M23 family metallopeptidase [Gallaecimonas kandeliae]|uniref:M23 family metallopeptidase n=1 Tax=Gallaecimonas kandeliae TaxID=3029055 RepID=UPI0026472FC5|nr:M23 family metallopeptidase [Gallaecimonas kandeliae]WKE66093.1 M23 family metallopeptidase [Gallaecimonas kandeliae]
MLGHNKAFTMTLTLIIDAQGRQRQWRLPLWLLLMSVWTALLLFWSLLPKAEAQVPVADPQARLDTARWQEMQQRLAQAEGQLAGLKVRAELLSRQLGLGPVKPLAGEGELKQLEEVLARLESWQGRHHMTSMAVPLDKSRKASGFGYRLDPITGKPRWHSGLDLAAPKGTEVKASGDGLVTFAGSYAGYGELVEIDHGDGIKSRYGHNSQLLVKRGDKVKKGQVIARVGQSGRATGPHLHFEVLALNQPRDPAHFVYRPGGL